MLEDIIIINQRFTKQPTVSCRRMAGGVMTQTGKLQGMYVVVRLVSVDDDVRLWNFTVRFCCAGIAYGFDIKNTSFIGRTTSIGWHGI